MPGRPRKPTKLHVLQGTLNATRHKDRGNEPIITAPIGEPPAFLTGHSLDCWNEVTTDPEYGQVLNRSHRETVAHYCVLYARFVADATGEEDMKASDRQTFHSLAMQLGRTPAAASKVATPAKPKAESPWDRVASK